MTKYEKIAFATCLIYVFGRIGMSIFEIFQKGQMLANHPALFLQLSWMTIVFYLGFKKKKLLFASLGVAWLFYWNVKAIYQIYSLSLHLNQEDGFNAILGGALFGQILLMLWTYFAFKALIETTKNSPKKFNSLHEICKGHQS